jgi:hypothetical protein
MEEGSAGFQEKEARRCSRQKVIPSF